MLNYFQLTSSKSPRFSCHPTPEADMLLVPYPSLVNKETRQKLGIRTQAAMNSAALVLWLNQNRGGYRGYKFN